MKLKCALAFLLCLSLCTFTGCEFPGSSTVQTSFELSAKITYEDLETSATIKQNGGLFALTFEEPESLMGMRFTYEQGSWATSYRGLSDTVPAEELQNSAVDGIFLALHDASSQQVVGKAVDGMTKYGSYTLKVDGDGYPASLSIPCLCLDAKFTLA